MADVLNGTAVGRNGAVIPSAHANCSNEALALFRELEEDRGVASLLGNLGDLAATVGEYDRAVTLSRKVWPFWSVCTIRNRRRGNC